MQTVRLDLHGSHIRYYNMKGMPEQLTRTAANNVAMQTTAPKGEQQEYLHMSMNTCASSVGGLFLDLQRIYFFWKAPMRVRVEEGKESKEKRRSHTLGHHYNCFRGKHSVSTPVIVLFSSKLTEYIKELTKTHPNTSLHHFLGPFCSQRAPK